VEHPVDFFDCAPATFSCNYDISGLQGFHDVRLADLANERRRDGDAHVPAFAAFL
jgi:hypothetical protein